WIFTARNVDAAKFGSLTNARLAGGPEGSGTRALVTQLQNAWGETWPEILPIGGASAADALRAGELDAVAFTASIEADYVKSLLQDEEYSLLAMPRADAISMRFPALAPVTLYQGVVDLSGDRPNEDVPLIAAIAQLGVSETLHPAIQAVLLEAAEKVHRRGTLISRPGAFPDPALIDLPLSPEAERYYRDGPTFLRRFFPFAVANFLERAWVFLIPLATVLIPLVQMAPPVYRWRIRRKIYVWYDDLHELEQRGFSAKTNDERQGVLADIRNLQMEIGEVDVPASYNDELFRLRSHIDFIQSLIRREQGEAPTDTAFIS
ncbi:MAG: TRAP transporter substrate-binding protein, partial [Pseudomonadota bacterium]